MFYYDTPKCLIRNTDNCLSLAKRVIYDKRFKNLKLRKRFYNNVIKINRTDKGGNYE